MLIGRTFLAGVILIVAGLPLNAALPTLVNYDCIGRHSFLIVAILDSALGLPLLGVALIAVGSILDKRHLNIHQSRTKGRGLLSCGMHISRSVLDGR